VPKNKGMLQPNDYVTKAGNYVKQAQSAEETGHLEEALGHYEQALIVLKAILQNKQCVYLGKSMTQYAESCLARAEQIRETLRSGVDPSPIMPHTGQDKNVRRGPPTTASSPSVEQNDERNAMLQQLALTRTEPGDYKVAWSDIIGMDGIKKLLDEAIRLPKEMPHVFTGNREPIRAVLLYGPPGTGKTLIGKALACESGIPFYSVSSADLISKYVGESEKNVKGLFDMLKSDKPCVLFLDEVDAMCGSREESNQNTKTVQQFLTQLNGISNNGDMDGIFLLACTNLPWALDEAMRRRLEHRIYVGLPTAEERAAMLKHYISMNDHSVTNEQFDEIATKYTVNFSASDIRSLCKKAAALATGLILTSTHFVLLPGGCVSPCQENDPGARPLTYAQIKNKLLIKPPALTYDHMMEELRYPQSTIDMQKLKRYEEWTKTFGKEFI
jgi:vacuolar protein-sorting-associated protein 4